MTIEANKQPQWWGSFKLEIDENKEWQIGQLKLIVRRLKNEWQIAHEPVADVDKIDNSFVIKNTDQLPESLKNNSRYVLRNTTGQLTVTPQLADRPVITRPHIPFNLSSGEEITLYVSSILWLELAIGSAPEKVLTSIAIQRLSDTWFGPSTLEGEFCYASTTHCRLDFEEIPKRFHRAITPVLIRNLSDTTLLLDRLNLPTPVLPLYTSSTGQLWTPQITLTREKDGDLAELKIDDKPPKNKGKMKKINDARKPADSSVLFRAFSTVFN